MGDPLLQRFRELPGIDIHSPAGEQLIKVVAESWLSYYGIAKLTADDVLIGDIVVLIDTFGPLMGISKGQGTRLTSVDLELLEKIVGQIVFSRGIVLGDSHALASLKEVCSAILDSDPISRLQGIDRGRLVKEGVAKVQETLSGDFYQDIEPPVIVQEVAQVCIYEIVRKYSVDSGKKLPSEIQDVLEDKIAEYSTLLRSYQRLRIIEDRIYHLLNASGYCDCIKRSLLTLKTKQLVTLALHYCDNQPIPDEDMLEAMADAGEHTTTHGTAVRQTNIDRNIHYLVRNVLPDRLANEFGRAIDGFIRNRETKRHIPEMLLPCLQDDCSGIPQVDPARLREFCSSGVGIPRGPLMSDALMEMCRILQGRSSSLEQTET